MRKAIVTKYHPSTNTLGPRISAKAPQLKRFVWFWDDNITDEENHVRAAARYCERYNWTGTTVMGYIPFGVIHVFIPNDMVLVERIKPLGELL